MIAVRAAGDPEDLAIVLRGIIRDLDPELALGDVRTLEDRLEERLARPRLYSIVIAGFSALALVIAAVGLFGVLSCTVAQRSRELAVRTALGATPQRVVGLVVRQALALTIAGLLIGFAASAMLGRVTSAYLFGVTSHDPATFAMVAVVLMAVTCLACAVPALRAVRVDPAVVLRE
jgi:putative ABC transport system permease protein